MSSIVKSEAVVLRSMKYRETSKIVKFYTKQFGTVSGIVKGARRAKSKFGGPCLEPMSHVAIVFYRKEGRDIQTVSECSLVRDYRQLGGSLEKMAAGMSIVELVSRVAREGDENPGLFQLLVRALQTVDESRNNPAVFLCHFELHLAAILGFRMSFDSCIICRRTPDPVNDTVTFHFDRGGVICGHCAGIPGDTLTLAPSVLAFLSALSGRGNPADVADIAVSDETVSSSLNVLWSHLRHHVPGLYPLRSERVFSRILPVP